MRLVEPIQNKTKCFCFFSPHTHPHRTAPHSTAPHSTAPHRAAPHRTTPPPPPPYGREGGLTNERPGSGHVIWGPMRGLEKNRMGRGQTDTHTDGHVDSMTNSAQRAELVKIYPNLENDKIEKTKELTKHVVVVNLFGQWMLLQLNCFTRETIN